MSIFSQGIPWQGKIFYGVPRGRAPGGSSTHSEICAKGHIQVHNFKRISDSHLMVYES